MAQAKEKSKSWSTEVGRGSRRGVKPRSNEDKEKDNSNNNEVFISFLLSKESKQLLISTFHVAPDARTYFESGDNKEEQFDLPPEEEIGLLNLHSQNEMSSMIAKIKLVNGDESQKQKQQKLITLKSVLESTLNNQLISIRRCDSIIKFSSELHRGDYEMRDSRSLLWFINMEGATPLIWSSFQSNLIAELPNDFHCQVERIPQIIINKYGHLKVLPMISGIESAFVDHKISLNITFDKIIVYHQNQIDNPLLILKIPSN